MPYKEFTETGSRNKEFISITANKTFGLSRNFLEAHSIGDYHKAVIYYDAAEKKIALYFSIFQPKNGINVRIPDPRYGGTIVAKSFFDIEKIDTKIYGGRYDDIKRISPDLIGASRIGGEAFEIQLKAKSVENENNNKYYDDDKPIDLSEIPF